MIRSSKTQASAKKLPSDQSEDGAIRVKFFWKISLLISVIVTVVGTIILNLIF